MATPAPRSFPAAARALLAAVLLWGAAPGVDARADTPAVADAATQAELVRLREELRRLSTRQVWKGVDRIYVQLEGMGAELDHRELLLAATAARELGDMAGAYERLTLAARIDATKEVVDWLWDIDRNYGRVVLSSNPDIGLVPLAPPFDPVAIQAIQSARKVLDEEGRFEGALPVGEYRLGDQVFEVTADHTADTPAALLLATASKRRKR